MTASYGTVSAGRPRSLCQVSRLHPVTLRQEGTSLDKRGLVNETSLFFSLGGIGSTPASLLAFEASTCHTEKKATK